ncbi:MAG: 30S ribosomal protein S6 [Caldilineaceae bacterium]|nr:30S ribosomal protein S6 [Caldilineaceae bacterium]
MNSYELVYIIQPELDDEGVKAVDDRITQAISGEDGTIANTDHWGKRRLAYPIKGHFEGHYILHNLSMPPAAVQNVERQLRLSEDVIRFLVVRVED